MKKKISILLASVILAGCSGWKHETSSTKKEDAVIVAMIYSPSEHRTEMTPAMSKGSNVGMNGEMGIPISENTVLTTTTIPERYGVVFQCQHGTFTVEGDNEGNGRKYWALYNKLNGHVGDTVTILYKEVYSVKYEDRDGKKVEVERTLYDMDFIDAQLKQP